jgi:hypothetical protein
VEREQVAKEILNEESMIEYRPPFLNGLELDAFVQKYQNSFGFIAPAGIE